MGRPLRKDAVVRRRAVLGAAAEVLAEHGLNAPLELIADRAGVGRATLYRNFPDRTHLVLAVLGQQLEDLARLTTARGDDPAALFGLLEDLAELSVHNAGFPAALRATAPEALAPLRVMLTAIGEPPLRRAQAAGLARVDLEPADILLISNMLGGAAHSDELQRRTAVRRVLSIIVDGLKVRS